MRHERVDPEAALRFDYHRRVITVDAGVEAQLEADGGVDFQQDVRPALGDRLDVAVLELEGEEVVAEVGPLYAQRPASLPATGTRLLGSPASSAAWAGVSSARSWTPKYTEAAAAMP